MTKLPIPEVEPLLYTVPEAARALRFSNSKMYDILASGRIPSVKIDGSRRVSVDALKAFVAENEKREGEWPE